jgi:hypothetical protein
MTIDNIITEFPRKPHVSTDITLDSVMRAITDWRTNKGTRGEQIPNEIWESVFTLVNTFPELPICAVLGITKIQYQRKLDERKSGTAKPTHDHVLPRMDFCEAKETPSPFYKPAKIPATNTLVVEFCRADGRIMKIHTTTDSFAELMKAFFGGG